MPRAVGGFTDRARLVQDATGCSDCWSTGTLGSPATTAAEWVGTISRASVGAIGTTNACADAGPADACVRALVAVCTTICYATDAIHATDVESGAGAIAVCESTTGTILWWTQSVRHISCIPAGACIVWLSAEWMDADAWTRAGILTLHAGSPF